MLLSTNLPPRHGYSEIFPNAAPLSLPWISWNTAIFGWKFLFYFSTSSWTARTLRTTSLKPPSGIIFFEKVLDFPRKLVEASVSAWRVFFWENKFRELPGSFFNQFAINRLDIPQKRQTRTLASFRRQHPFFSKSGPKICLKRRSPYFGVYTFFDFHNLHFKADMLLTSIDPIDAYWQQS